MSRERPLRLHDASGAAAVVTAPAVPRTRLASALLRREASIMTGILIVAGAVLAIAAARESYRALVEGTRTPFFGELIRRFDMTMLFVMAMLLTFRVAARTEMDVRDGWLAPLFAADDRRWRYGVLVASTSMVTPLAVFAATAVMFAFAMQSLSGARDLVVLLPGTLLAGGVLLGTFAVCAAAFGMVLRNGAAASGITLMLLFAPIIVTMRMASEAGPPLWLVLASFLAPLPFLPRSPENLVRGVLYILVGCLLVALLSKRYAGRTR
jgi:hypothetical protein